MPSLSSLINGTANDPTLKALSEFNTNGILAQTATSTFAGRTINGNANQILITNGDGVAGNPVVSLSSTINVPGAVTATSDDDGTLSSGTYTPTPIGGNFKRIVNNGSFTLAAPTAVGDYTLIIQITNGSSAGTITLSGFLRTTGDLLTTVAGHNFFVFITKCNNFTSASIQALQ
jgi:hypothetical protein